MYAVSGLLAVFAVGGCAGPQPGRLAISGAFESGLASLLPAIPSAEEEVRGGAAIDVTIQDGAEATSLSAGAAVAGTELAINAGPGGLEYGIYTFNAGVNVPVGVLAALAVNSGQNAWIAVANYATGTWQLAGPFPAAGATQFDNLGVAHRSPAGNVYFAVIAFDSTSVNVATVEFSVDNAPLVFDIAGAVTNSAGGGALEGVTITLTPGGDTALTNASGDYVFPGMAAGNYTVTPSLTGFTFAPPSQNVTIGPHALNVDFVGTAEAPQITYTNTIKTYLDTNCTPCHGSAGGVSLETYAEAVANGPASNSTIQAGTMPPGDPASEQEKADFQAWIDAGMPE